MSSIGRPLIPPDLLMRSTAIWVPTRAVLPPAAADPESGCKVPILYGLAWPNAACHGAGTSMVAPSAPAPAALHPISRRRVTLPRYQNSSPRSCASSLWVMAGPSWSALTYSGHRRERFGQDPISKRDFIGIFKQRAGARHSGRVAAGLPAQQPRIVQRLADA